MRLESDKFQHQHNSWLNKSQEVAPVFTMLKIKYGENITSKKGKLAVLSS